MVAKGKEPRAKSRELRAMSNAFLVSGLATGNRRSPADFGHRSLVGLE